MTITQIRHYVTYYPLKVYRLCFAYKGTQNQAHVKRVGGGGARARRPPPPILTSWLSACTEVFQGCASCPVFKAVAKLHNHIERFIVRPTRQKISVSGRALTRKM